MDLRGRAIGTAFLVHVCDARPNAGKSERDAIDDGFEGGLVDADGAYKLRYVQFHASIVMDIVVAGVRQLCDFDIVAPERDAGSGVCVCMCDGSKFKVDLKNHLSYSGDSHTQTRTHTHERTHARTHCIALTRLTRLRSRGGGALY